MISRFLLTGRMVEKKLVRVKVTTELRKREKTAKLAITGSPFNAGLLVVRFAPYILISL